MRSKGVPQPEINEAPKMNWQLLRSKDQRHVQAAALDKLGMDTFGALAVRKKRNTFQIVQYLSKKAQGTNLFLEAIKKKEVSGLGCFLVQSRVAV